MAFTLNQGRLSSIDRFKNQLLDGGARPSLFDMEIKWPINSPAGGLGAGLAVVGDEGLAEATLPFHCKISEIPSSQHTPITIKYQGREIKYAGQRTFTNLTVTILNDENFTVRKSLETWLDNINTAKTNVSRYGAAAPTPQGYAGQGTVKQYNKQGDVVRAYSFIDMFPVTLSNIGLSWDNDGQIEEYTCEFAYQYWEVANVLLPARPLGF